MRYKLIAIGTGAALAAIGGTFWAQYSGYVEPHYYLGPHVSLELLVFMTIGGMHSRWGVVASPLILVPVRDLARSNLGASNAGLVWILYGLLVILVLRFLPRGIVTWVEERLSKSS